jgi:hypothetical protein
VFTSNHDDHLALIMARHRIGEDSLNWEVITAEFGGDFTPRQLMNRWFLHLCPELTAANFTADERRTMLKLGINEYGNWNLLSQRMGNDPIRFPAQLRVVLAEMLARLEWMEIVIHDPEQVDLIPEVFFQAILSQEELCQIQVTFTERVAAQTRISSEEQNPKQ